METARTRGLRQTEKLSYPLYQNGGTERFSENQDVLGGRFELCRHQQDSDFGPLEKNLLPQLQPVNIRHLNVAQESMDRARILPGEVPLRTLR